MNRLANATSPYLLQHAANPVDWWPWCEEAFEAAKREDKAIFLSIGYATCHWCHVMAHESFENKITAEQMNRDFINIKLDREERPDLDGIYMAALQATQGNGGWPMSIFLDHERRPFFLATYLPPDQRYNRPSFKMVMSKLKEMWDDSREQLLTNASGLLDHLQRAQTKDDDEPAGTIPLPAIDRLAWTQLNSRFDKVHGGLGSRPKFPTSHVYDYLMRLARKGIETQAALGFVDFSLRKLQDGGIHDQVGGGFHRYSTDEHWLVPHFEKMLYDQAQIMLTAAQAWQLVRDPRHAAICHDVLRYLKADLRNPAGGYFSGEDADSEGVEGKFYVFTKQELSDVIGADEGEFVAQTLGVTEAGNYADEASGEQNGTNILHFPVPTGPSKQVDLARLTPLLAKLQGYRDQRVRPSLDDKVIASWNGLMLSALALAARAFSTERAEYLAEAKACADFLLSEMCDEQGNLYRSWRKGQKGHLAFLEDEAALSLGLLDLFQASGELRYLDASVLRAESMLEHFQDAAQGGFFQTRANASDVILRQKESYDGAEPSGNSLAAEALLRLGHLLQREDLRLAGEATLAAFGSEVSAMPLGHTRYLCALDYHHAKRREIVLALSGNDDSDAEAALALCGASFLPNSLLIIKRAENAEDLARWLPWTAEMVVPEKGFQAYICQDMSCQRPIDQLSELEKALS